MLSPAVHRVARYAYLVLIVAFLVGLVLQVYFVGQFVMGVQPENTQHEGLGWPLAHSLAPLVVLVSIFVGGGRNFLITSVLWGAVVFVLPILAAMAADDGSASPAAAGLHPLVAVIVIVATIWLTLRAWTMVRAGLATRQAATPAVRTA